MVEHLAASDPPIWYEQNRRASVDATPEDQSLPGFGYDRQRVGL